MSVNDFLHFVRKFFAQLNVCMLSNRLHVEVFSVTPRPLRKVEPIERTILCQQIINILKCRLPLVVIDRINFLVSF